MEDSAMVMENLITVELETEDLKMEKLEMKDLEMEKSEMEELALKVDTGQKRIYNYES